LVSPYSTIKMIHGPINKRFALSDVIYVTHTKTPTCFGTQMTSSSIYCNSNNKLAGCFLHLGCFTSLKMVSGCRYMQEVLYVLCAFYNEVYLLEDKLIIQSVTIFRKSFHCHNPGRRQMNKKKVFFQSSFPKEGKDVLCTAQ